MVKFDWFIFSLESYLHGKFLRLVIDNTSNGQFSPSTFVDLWYEGLACYIFPQEKRKEAKRNNMPQKRTDKKCC